MSSVLRLRCALVYERTMLSERVFSPGAQVTVGESPKTTFSIHSSCLGERHTLLRAERNSADLYLQEGMCGRIWVQGRWRGIDEILADSVERDSAGARCKLQYGDLGVLVFGRSGLMFELIEPPASLPFPPLGQILGTDRTFVSLFCCSLFTLSLVFLIARFFAVPAAELSVEQLPDRFVSLITESRSAARALKREVQEMRAEERRQKQHTETQTAARTTSAPRRNETAGERDDRLLRERVATKGVVGALSDARKKKGALSAVLEQGDLSVSLNDALRAIDRNEAQAQVITSTGTGTLALAPSERQPVSSPAGLSAAEAEAGTAAIGRAGRAVARASRLTERAEAEVALSMPAEAAQVSGGTLSREAIARVVKQNKGAVRYCYEKQLNRFPTLRGQVVVDFIIEPDGSVSVVTIKEIALSNATAAADVSSCLIRFVKRWRFPSPEGGKVRVIYPFTFGRTQ